MDSHLLVSVVKPTVHIKCGDQKTDFHSGCSVIDVTFPNVFYVEVAEIYFKNYYTASLTVKAKRKSLPGEPEPKWKTVARRMSLMPCVHAEQGAEDYFTLGSRYLPQPLTNITALRFILRQPSPIWKDFKIDDIRVYRAPMASGGDVTLPRWIHETSDETEERTLKGISSIPAVSKNLQQLWALSDHVGSQQPTAAIGRCDVDGCYDISLLSYT